MEPIGALPREVGDAYLITSGTTFRIFGDVANPAGESYAQASTFTIIHTARVLPPGQLKGFRSKISESSYRSGLRNFLIAFSPAFSVIGLRDPEAQTKRNRSSSVFSHRVWRQGSKDSSVGSTQTVVRRGFVRRKSRTILAYPRGLKSQKISGGERSVFLDFLSYSTSRKVPTSDSPTLRSDIGCIRAQSRGRCQVCSCEREPLLRRSFGGFLIRRGVASPVCCPPPVGRPDKGGHAHQKSLAKLQSSKQSYTHQDSHRSECISPRNAQRVSPWFSSA